MSEPAAGVMRMSEEDDDQADQTDSLLNNSQTNQLAVSQVADYRRPAAVF